MGMEERAPRNTDTQDSSVSAAPRADGSWEDEGLWHRRQTWPSVWCNENPEREMLRDQWRLVLAMQPGKL